MRNTRRATIVALDDDINSQNKEVVAHSGLSLRLDTTPPHNKSASSSRQVFRSLRTEVSGHRLTFASILQSERWSNIAKLKTRGFVGNQIAKLVAGHSQALCYRVKNAAIVALVKHGAASLLSLEPSSRGPIIGLAFVGGGRLHVKPAGLDPQATRALQAQFAATLRNGRYFSGETRDENL